MDKLPQELLDNILCWCVLNCRGEKNLILPLRLVSKSFSNFLSPIAFRTIQLEFSKFLVGRGQDTPSIDSISGVRKHCQALYCDMMVIRDDEEIERLHTVFSSVVHSVPEMTPLLQSLRNFCMSKEDDYKRVMAGVLNLTPNLTRLKLNLPFQVIGKASRTATMLLATTFETLASRSSEHKPLEVLVLDHVSDSSIFKICNNPSDLKYARDCFVGLKSLILSIKRQENEQLKLRRFTYFLWHLICHATKLESLCLIGWNTKRSPTNRVEVLDRTMVANDWFMKSLPYPTPNPFRPTDGLKHLRCLELKRVDIESEAFVHMIEENSHSLKELYLNEVHLKIRGPTKERDPMSLWIGHAPEQTRPQKSIWIAEWLREKESLQLDILRATSLGYDDYSSLSMQNPNDPPEEYDLKHPSDLRSFDLRFVERAMGFAPPPKRTTPTASDPESSNPPKESTPPPPSVPKHLYEVEAYQRTLFPYSPKDNPFRRETSFHEAPLTQVQSERSDSCKVLVERELLDKRDNNTTSQYKRSIDGIFYNHNERALAELQKIIGVVDRSMNLLSEEIERISREAGEIRE